MEKFSEKKALLQSRNVIFDLRHMQLSERVGLSKLEKEYSINSQLRKLYIIRKNGDLIVHLSKH